MISFIKRRIEVGENKVYQTLRPTKVIIHILPIKSFRERYNIFELNEEAIFKGPLLHLEILQPVKDRLSDGLFYMEI